MTPNAKNASFDSWTEAAGLIHRWLEKAERLDELMERIAPNALGIDRARVQNLVYGVVRHHIRISAKLNTLMQHAPRFRVQAVLYVAGYELIEACGDQDSEGQVAKVVHHAVERSKSMIAPAEFRMVNAVLRKLGGLFLHEEAPPSLAPAARLAEFFSHPDWLVRRWLAQFGAANTRALLEWNQQPAPVYARWRTKEGGLPEWLVPSSWPQFYSVTPGNWREVEGAIQAGQIYIQDPSTRLAIDLTEPKPGEKLLDLCAAPGGKSVHLADRMGEGLLVSVDLPGLRQDRLKENLGRLRGVESIVIQADVARTLPACLSARKVPSVYDAVLIDVPCSNTGVMRHRVDVKERLRESDIFTHAKQQLVLLAAAAKHVAPGGRLIYSTCSIDPEENEKVVKAFLKDHGSQFSLEAQVLSYPWTSQHDGAACFRLKRKQG